MVFCFAVLELHILTSDSRINRTVDILTLKTSDIKATVAVISASYEDVTDSTLKCLLTKVTVED